MKYKLMYETIFNKSNKKILKNYKFFSIKKIKNPKKIHIIYSFLKKRYDKKYLSKFSNLKFFVTASTGTDHVDVEYLKKKKIKIIKLDTSSKEVKKITSSAELALTLILTSIRKVHQYLNLTKSEIIKRDYYNFFQFRNYKVGIIGYGRIGKYLDKNLKNLNFSTTIYDKSKKYFKSNLKKLLISSDIITTNIPLGGNYQFINSKMLNLCKKNVKIINISRANIFNQKDLFNFLKKNPNTEYWTDVFINEQENSKKVVDKSLKAFLKLNNFYLTPHVGGAALDAMNLAEKIVFKKLINL